MKTAAALVMLCAACGISGTLYQQSVATALKAKFTNPAVQYLLLDLASNEVTASRWADSNAQLPLGSLVKPFLALAYGEAHAGGFPLYQCNPSECWLPRGHGRIAISDAIAQSCNSYFLQLGSHVAPDEVRRTLMRFQLSGPGEAASARDLIGLGDAWRMGPLPVLRAYAKLVRDGGVNPVLVGLARAAKAGTARAVGPDALAKTGTAPCVHKPRAPGDGYTVAVFPSTVPRFALMVQVHGTTGAHAAVAAGEMMRVIRGVR
jgi:cell division protein FtsI/penicillin-binding protein 2